MFAVFVAFVPEGEATIKPSRFGLAVGVFVDAFIVRMTLVPAVLTLLGHRAWWLPRWMDRRLPSFDVEGAGLAHQVALARLAGSATTRTLSTPRVWQVDLAPRVAGGVRRARCVVVDGGRQRQDRTAAHPLGRPDAAGRPAEPRSPDWCCPSRPARFAAGLALVDCAADHRPGGRRARAGPRGPAAAGRSVDHADVLTGHDDRAALASLVDDLVGRRRATRPW